MLIMTACCKHLQQAAFLLLCRLPSDLFIEFVWYVSDNPKHTSNILEKIFSRISIEIAHYVYYYFIINAYSKEILLC